MVGYVDDGAYSYADTDPERLSRILTGKFNVLEQWMNSNKLVLNAENTRLIVLLSRKNDHRRAEVTMRAGNNIIKPSVCERMLGVIYISR